jgi:hypothetical protein
MQQHSKFPNYLFGKALTLLLNLFFYSKVNSLCDVLASAICNIHRKMSSLHGVIPHSSVVLITA